MPTHLTSLQALAALPFDTLIDVRTPDEFAEDHIPGAINLPALSNEERATVGTIYKQQSPFLARKLGGALVARNVAAHLLGPLAHHDGGWKPLVYCWRGGQRSGSFAIILKEIGWRVDTVAGGYKAFRALVVEALYNTPFAAPVVVLDGNTGSAKTEILNRLPGLGLQVLDLEGLARHRGSLFGAVAGGQPAQKGFETALALQIAALDPTRPVVVEAESSKVGECRLPPELWKAMQAAPRVVLQAPAAARAAYLTRAYDDLIADAARLSDTIAQLRHSHAAEVIAGWTAQAQTGQFQELAQSLIEQHYDPRYDKHRVRGGDGRMVAVQTPSLQAADMDGLAERVAEAVRSLAPPLPPQDTP